MPFTYPSKIIKNLLRFLYLSNSPFLHPFLFNDVSKMCHPYSLKNPFSYKTIVP